MLAAGTRSPGVMVVGEVPEPEPPGPRDVIVRPEAVGICGSDLHFYTGDTGALSGARSSFPRVQGHEFSAIIEQLGRDCPGGGGGQRGRQPDGAGAEDDYLLAVREARPGQRVRRDRHGLGEGGRLGPEVADAEDVRRRD